MSAVISPCEQFRYRLDRIVAEAGIVFAFFGVNPSTAGAEIEDQTTMKWRGFTVRNGGRAYIAGNPFAYRATDVRALASAPDAVGPCNHESLLEIVRDADVLVPCWGSISKVPPRLRWHFGALRDLLAASGKPIKVFGLTKDGSPKHPLMLGYDTVLQPWGAK